MMVLNYQAATLKPQSPKEIMGWESSGVVGFLMDYKDTNKREAV